MKTAHVIHLENSTNINLMLQLVCNSFKPLPVIGNYLLDVKFNFSFLPLQFLSSDIFIFSTYILARVSTLLLPLRLVTKIRNWRSEARFQYHLTQYFTSSLTLIFEVSGLCTYWMPTNRRCQVQQTVFPQTYVDIY